MAAREATGWLSAIGERELLSEGLEVVIVLIVHVHEMFRCRKAYDCATDCSKGTAQQHAQRNLCPGASLGPYIIVVMIIPMEANIDDSNIKINIDDTKSIN